MISYIQPFEDGNKRTARVVGNALLLANGFCPLSYKSVDEVEYKKSMIMFYEQNSIHYFKQLFVEQFKIAISKYFWYILGVEHAFFLIEVQVIDVVQSECHFVLG